jgi:hypothetical protein
MKRLITIAFLVSPFSWGGTITLLSGVSPGGSNNLGANVLITPIPEWTTDPTAKWISYMNTGVGGTFIASSSSVAAGRFFQSFIIPTGTNFFGSITVWADDTAAVYLDGALLVDATKTLGAHCSNGPITCQGGGYIIPLTGNNTPGQTHTLEFDVFQLGGDVFGLLYNGQVSFSDAVAAPEPGSFALIGGGLLALAGISRKFARR